MFHLQLITLTGTEIDEDIHEVMVPTTAGTIAINQGHAPLLGEIAPGVMTIKKNKADRDTDLREYGVYDGTIEVLKNNMRVLVDDLDSPGEVNEQEVEAALKRAHEMQAKAKDAVSLAQAQQLVDRSHVRLKLAGMRKHSKRKY